MNLLQADGNAHLVYAGSIRVNPSVFSEDQTRFPSLRRASAAREGAAPPSAVRLYVPSLRAPSTRRTSDRPHQQLHTTSSQPTALELKVVTVTETTMDNEELYGQHHSQHAVYKRASRDIDADNILTP